MTTVNRSSTISQPTAIRPCGASSSPRSSRVRSRTTVLATETASPRMSPPPIPQPSATPRPTPEGGRDDELADGARDRDPPDGQQVLDRELDPDPEHQQDHADLGELAGDLGVRDDARRERAERDAGGDVADDGREPEPLGDQAADEGGNEPDGDGRDENGLVVHGSSRRGGWAQDWRGSVPERRLGGPDTIPHAGPRPAGLGRGEGDDEPRWMGALERRGRQTVGRRRAQQERVRAVAVDSARDVELGPAPGRERPRVREDGSGRARPVAPRQRAAGPARPGRGDRRAVRGSGSSPTGAAPPDRRSR